MEKVMKKAKGKSIIKASDVFCAVLAVLIGYGQTVLSPMMIFLFVAYSYLRSNREAYISVFFIMLFALEKGVLTAYFYALGFSLFFVLLHTVKILNRSFYQWMPFIISVVLIPYAIRQFGITSKALIEPILGGLLLYQACQGNGWASKRYVLSESMYGAVLMHIGILLSALMPLYTTQIVLLMYLLIALICDSKTTAGLLGIVLLLPMAMEELLIIVLCCMIFRSQRFLCIAILGMSVFFLPWDIFHLSYLGIAAFSVLALRREYVPLLALDQAIPQRGMQETSDHLLRRQMQNYAGIFQSLAEYYEGIQDIGSELLYSMANALQYNAEEIQKVDTSGKQYDRLRKALEGYQFHVEELHVDERRDGSLHIAMEIGNLRRGEIHMTLQPLLEALLHRHLQVLEIHKKRFVRGFSILLCDALPYEVEAYGDSIKNAYTGNGDSYSIFRFRQSMICMISDGMGNGDNAAKSSRLITSIFQRMVVSGMPQDSAIRCINKLIQSDTYATLDVIGIDRCKGTAFISKSAACPTFLIRDGQLHEINGTALPVGIIATMEPDCFEIALQDEDEFLMISDGITRTEIDAWLRNREGNDTREDLAFFSEQVSRQRRKDDSTILLMKVHTRDR